MKLVSNKANWEDLVAQRDNEGKDKVDERLRTVYAVSPGAATALVFLTQKLCPLQGP